MLKRIRSIFFLFIGLIFSAAFVNADTITANQWSKHNGYHVAYWRDGGAATMKLGPNGNFEIDWDVRKANFVGGKGWRTGSANRIVGYNASVWKPKGTAYLTFYGWTRNPIIEYYVVDSWGKWRPPGGRSMGTVKSDGGRYDLYRTIRENAPSIDGTGTFYQYWSVRKTKRRTGRNQKITFANHVKAWTELGWPLGRSHSHQIMAIEGYHSTGKANVTIWQE